MSQLGLVGQLSAYDENVEDFALYTERLEQYFIANDIHTEKKAAILISALGPKTYKLLRNLLTPKLPKDCTYEEIVTKLNTHFRPTPITVAERFRFHKRNQLKDENISAYVVELKRLASTCEFGDFLEEALRDRFVCGLCCESTQKKLLAKKNLKFSDACDIALAMELAEQDATNIKIPMASVNKVAQNKNSSSQKVNKTSNKSRETFNKSKCYRCGALHSAEKCKFKNARCHACGKLGHIAPVCRSKGKQNISAKMVSSYDNNEEVEELSLFSVASINKVSQKYLVPVTICNKHIKMELDTAADASIISETWFCENLPEVKLQPANVLLRDYNQHSIDVLGEVYVTVCYNKQVANLPAIVVKGNKTCLFGRDWISKFKLNWKQIFSINGMEHKPPSCADINSLCDQYKDLFQVSTEPIKLLKASLKMKDLKPVFCKARPVPYSLKKRVEEEIIQTKERKVWDFVDHSDWATPIVIVPKKNGSIRLCGDFKVTVNKCLDQTQYPLPTQQDLFATLNGGKYFSKLDLTHAYQQVELDDTSKEYLTLNTHLGLVRPTRLLYGINSASAIFQQIMDQILQGLPHVLCFQDDILITGSSVEDHIHNLHMVFQRLQKYNVKLNRDKCKFLQGSVEFLGHMIDEHGIHPTDEKIKCIKQIKSPTNITELKSFIGLLNYYAKFVRNYATLLAPLYSLLHKDTPWNWSFKCEQAFKTCKSLLSSETVLVHYQENLPLRLACDASHLGLGAVLSHIVDGIERPVAYASRTLSKAEKNYSQIEKEAASIIYGVKKFNQYLFGRSFVLITDHRPLVSIFAPDKAVPPIAAARLQRWAILLSSYNYTIEYKKGAEHGNADGLSRAPVDGEEVISDIFKISFCDELPVTSKDIALATRNDVLLGPVLKYVQNGWPAKVLNPELKPFFNRRDQLSVDNNCVLWGMRVIVPEKYRSQILELLHDTHPGSSKMKALARSHVWWPHLDHQIEEIVRKCVACQENASSVPAVPLQPWIWARSPWDRVHLDFAQKGDKSYLLMVDSHSKWLEVIPMHSTTSMHTIRALEHIFSRYGVPVELVSDNGPQLTSEEFENYLKMNGIRHTLIPFYHAKSNGLAERAVKTFKTTVNKMLCDTSDKSTVDEKICRFLMAYRSTPHCTTGLSPSEMFLGRSIRTALSLVHPCTQSKVQMQQWTQKHYHDRAHNRNRSFVPNQKVWVKSTKNQIWKKGTIVKPQGSTTWIARCGDKSVLAHADQLRADYSTNSSVEPVAASHTSDTQLDDCASIEPEMVSSAHSETVSERSVAANNTISQAANESNPTIVPSESQTSPITNDSMSSTSAVRRNPPRARNKPKRLNL